MSISVRACDSVFHPPTCLCLPVSPPLSVCLSVRLLSMHRCRLETDFMSSLLSAGCTRSTTPERPSCNRLQKTCLPLLGRTPLSTQNGCCLHPNCMHLVSQIPIIACRVYKNYDPRATIIKQVAEDVFAIAGRDPLINIAVELEKIARSDDYFVSRKLYPNVDFYSGQIALQHQLHYHYACSNANQHPCFIENPQPNTVIHKLISFHMRFPCRARSKSGNIAVLDVEQLALDLSPCLQLRVIIAQFLLQVT